MEKARILPQDPWESRKTERKKEIERHAYTRPSLQDKDEDSIRHNHEKEEEEEEAEEQEESHEKRESSGFLIFCDK